MTIERTSPVTPSASVQPRVVSDTVSSYSKQPRSEKNGTTHSTSVTLSDVRARLLQVSPEDINSERVEALKIAISQGKLTMDSGKIADALIQQTRDLLKEVQQ